MGNSKLSAYWKWRINSATEIEKFGLKFTFRKISKQNSWQIIIIDVETGLRVYQETIQENDDMLTSITKKCLNLTRLVYQQGSILSGYFDNQYRLWKKKS